MDGRDNTRIRPGERVPRVGLFGGTFDPVHLGHIRVADEVRAGFGLHRMIVIPSAVPPHKRLKQVSDAGDRLAMVRMCFENRDGYEVSSVELERSGPSYTVDTIGHFLNEYPPPHEVFLLMGTDSFFEIHTWRDYGKIFRTIPVIVMRRPGFPTDIAEKAGHYLKTHVAPEYRCTDGGARFAHDTFRDVYFFDVSPYDISSTEIRHRVQHGEDVSFWLQDGVADYIRKKGLYV
jgi:nicotinate-nucleotide adenylyltransferase